MGIWVKDKVLLLWNRKGGPAFRCQLKDCLPHPPFSNTQLNMNREGWPVSKEHPCLPANRRLYHNYPGIHPPGCTSREYKAFPPLSGLNPANGLCLAGTQDAAFARHRITLDEDYCLVVSKRIRDFYDLDTLRENFAQFEGQKITLPKSDFVPGRNFWKNTAKPGAGSMESNSQTPFRHLIPPSF